MAQHAPAGAADPAETDVAAAAYAAVDAAYAAANAAFLQRPFDDDALALAVSNAADAAYAVTYAAAYHAHSAYAAANAAFAVAHVAAVEADLAVAAAYVAADWDALIKKAAVFSRAIWEEALRFLDALIAVTEVCTS